MGMYPSAYILVGFDLMKENDLLKAIEHKCEDIYEWCEDNNLELFNVYEEPSYIGLRLAYCDEEGAELNTNILDNIFGIQQKVDRIIKDKLDLDLKSKLLLISNYS